MLRAVSVKRAGEPDAPSPFDVAVLAQDERHVRRRVITLKHGDKVLVDFAEVMVLGDGDLLVLADGRHAGIVAAEEELYEIRGRDAVHRAELAWHIGNRHLAAAIEPDRILILRDHVIRAMLEGLGATVCDVVEVFRPVRGAYSKHQHVHARDHTHGHHNDHGHHHHE